MNISYKWLKEYVDCPLSPQALADVLINIGLDVDGVEERATIRGGLKGLFVGEVLSCVPHPNSDHLHVTQVDLGRGTAQQIVCGAPNVAAGQKVIVADIGCVLYADDKEYTIKKSKLRGVDSYGMICAEDEIGIGSSHDGILVLPSDAVVGTPAADYFHVESDWIITLDLTANRGDALSHWGVARDLYAWLRQNGYPQTTLHRPSCDAFRVDDESLPIEIEIANVEACQRYVGVTVSDCDIKDSPAWLKEKLTAVGLRPINNIVDITNYIMYAYGQPMHCFDADMVGKKVIVQTLPAGTPFVTLDGVEHTLSSHDLCICNTSEPMCIGGVFGGKGSGTYPTTRNVLLESALFHPTYIRKSARRHGLATDASYRFERGVDPHGQIYAIKQAAILCRELAGGKVSMQIKDVYPAPIKNAEVHLSYDYCDTLVGKKIERQTIAAIAHDLGMTILKEESDGLLLEVPAYRVDVLRPCDVVEEILRIYGYNNVEIPSVLHAALAIPGDEDRDHRLKNIISEQLVGSGNNEILNNSLTKNDYYSALEAYPAATTVHIVNPLSADLGSMRQTLLFGGLESIARNCRRQKSNLRFFEFGKCYHYSAERETPDNPMAAYSEEQHLALWATGKHIEGAWAHPNEDNTFFLLKAEVENILLRMGIGHARTQQRPSTNDIFSSAIEVVLRGGKCLVEMGIVAPRLTAMVEVAQPVFFADIHWDTLLAATKTLTTEYKEVSKFPAVSRDLALLVDSDVSFQRIEEVAYKVERRLLRKVSLFDVYEGKHLPAGKKSYAVRFVLQDDTATLTDAAIDGVMQRLIAAYHDQLAAELR